MYTIYKSRSACQVKLIKTKFGVNQAGYQSVEKAGCILVEMANGNNRNYDWSKENKLTFAIGDGDLAAVYAAFESINRTGQGELKLFHDKNAGTDKGKDVKTLSLIPSTDPAYANTFFLKIAHGTKSINISLTLGEFLVIYEFIKQNQAALLGMA